MCGILEEFSQSVGRRLPLLHRLVDGADEATYLLEAAQSTLVDGPVSILGAIRRLVKVQDHAQLREYLLFAVRLQVVQDPLQCLFVK